jgi:SAM-dependent methyltransferase
MSLGLREFARRRQFNPGIVGIFLTPFFLSRRALWREIAAVANTVSGTLLDVGCGTKPYSSLFLVDEYVGLDIDSEISRRRGIAEKLYDGTRFPFDSQHFDVVLCNQVLEHVFNPDEFISELHRVLKPGGQLILTVPFVWDEHEQPFDYARYTSFGLKALLARNGLTLTVQKKTLADVSVLFQLANAYLFKVLSPKRTASYLIASTLVFAPVSLLGWLAGLLFPKNPDLYLDQVVVAQKSAIPSAVTQAN